MTCFKYIQGVFVWEGGRGAGVLCVCGGGGGGENYL